MSVCDSCSDDKELCSSSRLLSQPQVSLYTTIAGSIRTNEKDRENQKSRIKVGQIQARTPHSVWWWICELRSLTSCGGGKNTDSNETAVPSEYTGSCSDSNECTARRVCFVRHDLCVSTWFRPDLYGTAAVRKRDPTHSTSAASRVNSGARAPDTTNRQSNLCSPSNCARVLKQ